jgi:hypothetical protein
MLRILSKNGSAANFDDNDVMFVLELLDRALETGEATSRGEIALRTGIGEGVVRTILHRLRSMGLAEVSRAGTSISSVGHDFMRATGMSLVEIGHTDSAIGAHQVAVLVKGKAAMIEKGIEQRNCAIRIGADGCTTIVCTEGSLILPPDWNLDERSPELASCIRRHGIEDGDVVLIGGSDSGPRLASAASNSAALALLERSPTSEADAPGGPAACPGRASLPRIGREHPHGPAAQRKHLLDDVLYRHAGGQRRLHAARPLRIHGDRAAEVVLL